MGKQRGFKPQGIANPVMLARQSRPAPPSGQTIRDRLDQPNRPSWQDVKAAAQKKEKSSSDYLEQWENKNFQKELEEFREAKRGMQERMSLEEMKEKRKKSSAAPVLSSDSSDSDSESSSSSSCKQRHQHHPSRSHRGRHHSKAPTDGHETAGDSDTGDVRCRGDKESTEKKKWNKRKRRKRRSRSCSESSSSSNSEYERKHSKRRRKYSSSVERNERKRKKHHSKKVAPLNPHKMSDLMKMTAVE